MDGDWNSTGHVLQERCGQRKEGPAGSPWELLTAKDTLRLLINRLMGCWRQRGNSALRPSKSTSCMVIAPSHLPKRG